MYHIVYDKTGVHIDIFQQTKSEQLDHLFTLRRDEYYNEDFYPIFYRVGDNWRLIFNRRYGGLSVYELPNGNEIFKNIKPFEFLGALIPLETPVHNGRFYFALSWVWNPHMIPNILDLEAIAINGTVGKCHISGKYEDYIIANDKFDDRELAKFKVNSIININDEFNFEFVPRDPTTFNIEHATELAEYEIS